MRNIRSGRKIHRSFTVTACPAKFDPAIQKNLLQPLTCKQYITALQDKYMQYTTDWLCNCPMAIHGVQDTKEENGFISEEGLADYTSSCSLICSPLQTYLNLIPHADLVITHALEWPSLTVQWLPVRLSPIM